MDRIILSEIQKDMFNEIGNLGAGYAATALSTMIDKRVNITLPSVTIVQKSDLFQGDEEILVVNSRLAGDLSGNLLVVYDKQRAFMLIDLLNGNPKGTMAEIDELGKSVFKEMVNIVGGHYLNSLADITGLRVMPYPPTFSYGRPVSVRDGILAELPGDVYEVVFVETGLSVEGETIFGNLFLVLDKRSLDNLLVVLERKQGGA